MEKIPPLHHIEKKLEMDYAAVESAVKKYATPVFLYDYHMLKENYISLRNFLPKEVSVYYSVKANPNKWITSEFVHLGAGVEIASYGELKMLEEIGVRGENTILLGPGKRDELLELAVKRDIAFIVIESAKELEKLAEIAAAMHKRVNVVFRVNPVFKSCSRISMSGNTQFGIDEEEAEGYFLNHDKYPSLNLVGIHIYVGTGIMEEEVFLHNTEQILEIGRAMQERCGHRFSFLGIGGGLGVPVYEKDRLVQLDSVKERFCNAVKEYSRKYPQTKIAMEAGRYLVANAGVFITRVTDVKEVKGRKYLILDGGTNNLLYPERFGVKIPPLEVVGRQSAKPEKVTLCGPLCTPTDRMAGDVLLPGCEEGDIIVFYQAGAYGLTAAPGLFLSHGYPMEIMWKNREFQIIRKRFGWREILKQQEVNE